MLFCGIIWSFFRGAFAPAGKCNRFVYVAEIFGASLFTSTEKYVCRWAVCWWWWRLVSFNVCEWSDVSHRSEIFRLSNQDRLTHFSIKKWICSSRAQQNIFSMFWSLCMKHRSVVEKKHSNGKYMFICVNIYMNATVLPHTHSNTMMVYVRLFYCTHNTSRDHFHCKRLFVALVCVCFRLTMFTCMCVAVVAAATFGTDETDRHAAERA